MTLELCQDARTVATYSLPDGDFSWHVGRLATSDVQIPANDVSREHAVLARIGGVLTLVDAGSKFGVWNGDDRLAGPMVMAPGDDIRILFLF